MARLPVLPNPKRVLGCVRLRAGGTPVFSSICGCKAMCGSEQKATVSSKHTPWKEIADHARLPHQEPVHLQIKEETNREANNFYLKSCPPNWVRLVESLSRETNEGDTRSVREVTSKQVSPQGKR